MLNIEFLEAKNHEKTVKINDLFLHSAYSPSNEASKFVNNIKFDFNFNNLFIIEPGLGYTIKYFKEKFPDKNLFIIKLTDKIPLLDSFDKVINFFSYRNSLDFENFFYNTFTEIEILTSQFVSCMSIEKFFFDEYSNLCNSLKTILNRSKSVLFTRGYFEKKWLKNSCNNLKYLSSYVTIQKKLKCPIVIAASGPSLNSVIQLLKKYKHNIFIICVSSAITPLINNDIIPDLCISSDGGYWAGHHLESLSKKDLNTVLAIPMEAYCPKAILQNNIILPLSYNDGISFNLENKTNINFYKAERNGTVSGTALKLAQTLTEENIYLCGLDLQCKKGFQHTKPNKIENNKIFFSNKINSLQKNLIGSEFSNESLITYKNWFSMQKTNNKVFRIIENSNNNLNEILDINYIQFDKLLSSNKKNKDYIFSDIISITDNDKNKNLSRIVEYISKHSDNEQWLKDLFPLDYVSLIHSKSESDRQLILNKINISNNKLILNLKSILKNSEF